MFLPSVLANSWGRKRYFSIRPHMYVQICYINGEKVLSIGVRDLIVCLDMETKTDQHNCYRSLPITTE